MKALLMLALAAAAAHADSLPAFDLAGLKEPSLIYFWADWCAGCPEGLAPVAKVAQERGLKAVAVAMASEGAAREPARQCAEVQGLQCFRDQDGKAMDATSVPGMPAVVLWVPGKGALERWSDVDARKLCATVNEALGKLETARLIDDSQPPADFELTARFYPGPGGGDSWEVRVSSNGAVRDETLEAYQAEIGKLEKEIDEAAKETNSDDPKVRHRAQGESESLGHDLRRIRARERSRRAQVPAWIDAAKLRRLYGVILRARFMELPRTIKPETPAADQATFELAVRAAGAEHESGVTALESVRGEPPAERFAEVWREVTALVPSPGADLNRKRPPDGTPPRL